MAPKDSKPTPLPVAADHAAITNRINLLLSNRRSLIKSLLPETSSTLRVPAANNQEAGSSSRGEYQDHEDLWKLNRPNEGVGFVPESKAGAGGKDSSREDRALRGRLLGKGKKADFGAKAGKQSRAYQSESDDEMGRSGLGKRKRPRREASVEKYEEVEDTTRSRPEDVAKSITNVVHAENMITANVGTLDSPNHHPIDEANDTGDEERDDAIQVQQLSSRKKKKKNKRKNKKSKEAPSK